MLGPPGTLQSLVLREFICQRYWLNQHEKPWRWHPAWSRCDMFRREATFLLRRVLGEDAQVSASRPWCSKRQCSLCHLPSRGGVSTSGLSARVRCGTRTTDAGTGTRRMRTERMLLVLHKKGTLLSPTDGTDTGDSTCKYAILHFLGRCFPKNMLVSS